MLWFSSLPLLLKKWQCEINYTVHHYFQICLTLQGVVDQFRWSASEVNVSCWYPGSLGGILRASSVTLCSCMDGGDGWGYKQSGSLVSSSTTWEVPSSLLGDRKWTGRWLEWCWWRTVDESGWAHYKTYLPAYEIAVIAAKKIFLPASIASTGSRITPLFKAVCELITCKRLKFGLQWWCFCRLLCWQNFSHPFQLEAEWTSSPLLAHAHSPADLRGD